MTQLPARPTQKILRQDDAARWVEGYAFLQAARDEAQTVRANLQRMSDEARQDGFARGREEGLQEASRLLVKTTASVERYLDGLEQAVADLALDIVRQVLEPMDDGELLVRCTRKALGAFRDDQALTVQVAPARVETVRAQLEREFGNRFSVEGDASIGEDNARLSSATASVEIGLDLQLAAIREALLPHSTEGRP